MKCFYHLDLDGEASGAIVRRHFADCDMRPINYGHVFPWDDIERGELVYMVDFSLPADDMLRLDDVATLIWIDHHRTAIEGVSSDIKGIRREGLGACALVWEWIHGDDILPEPIRLIAEYDVWDHTDPHTLPFQYGMQLENTSPESCIWNALLDGMVGIPTMLRVIEQGETVLKYKGQSNKIYAGAAAFDVEFDGLRFIAVNKMMTNSQLFDSVYDEESYDGMIAFGWRKGKWYVSMYSTKVDVSKVAVAYGGGGHPGACGFNCDVLPFALGGAA